MSKISVGIYEGEGANHLPLESCLKSLDFSVRRIKIEALNALEKQEIAVLYLPGGWYQFEPGINQKIVAWVRGGGGIIGTCAGSYLVGEKIGLFPARVLRANFRGRLYLEPQQQHPILRGVVQPCTRHDQRPHGEPIAVTHLGGPLIFPDDKSTIVASYDFEGEVGAIVASQVGQGRAVAIASHPELDLADLPAADNEILKSTHFIGKMPQGDTRLLIRNAVCWAAQRSEF